MRRAKEIAEKKYNTHALPEGMKSVKKGACYEVKIVDGNKAKTLYVHPMHMKKQ